MKEIAALPSDSPPDWKLAGSREYTRERRVVSDALQGIAAEQERLREKAKSLEARLAALDAGARVFGFKHLDDQGHSLSDVGPSTEGSDGASQPFKDAVLRALRDAYPHPLKAAEIRSKAETALSKSFHEKTAGMTLYRLSKDGHVRREGHRWFFVPDGNRDQSRAPGDPATSSHLGQQEEDTMT